MSHWPQPAQFASHQTTITAWSSLGMMNGIGASNAPFSGTLGTAPRMFAFPFRLPCPMLVQRAFWMNGATVAGNVIAGIYGCTPSAHSDGSEIKLVESTSKAQSGVNAIQSVALGPIFLRAGLYWGAFIYSDSTATFFRCSTGFDAQEARHLGSYRRDPGSFALPATLGTPRTHVANIPLFGLATQTVI